jgi:hypothetical protein
MTQWYRWPLGVDGLPAGDRPVSEVHVVPEPNRRHRPQLCWCDPVLDLVDGVPRLTHRQGQEKR